MKIKKLVAVLTIAVLTFSVGCDSQRLNQFASFAAAGSQYVQASHKVIEQAGSAMISADSAVLLTARSQAGTGNRADVIKNDRMLETYLENLRKIDSHATLLGSYFDAITQLTNGKAAAGVSSSATALLDAISKTFNPQIEKLSFGGKTVGDFVSTGSSLIVAHFEVKALNDHLQKSAPIVDHALALQEAAMAAIAEQMKASLQASLEVKESTDVIEPYVTGPPANWNSTRESFLRTKVTIDDVEHAKAAITKLRSTFRELVQNPHATIDLTALINEINKLADFAKAVDSSTKNSK